MPRTIVPPEDRDQLRSADPGSADSRTEPPDGLSEKLVKYVPAETLAFFVPSAALFDKQDRAKLIVTLVAGGIGTVGYLWMNARNLPARQQPFLHFYLLSVVAFLAWSLVTSPNVAALAGADSKTTSLVLLAAVFLIPLADGVLTQLLRKRR